MVNPLENLGPQEDETHQGLVTGSMSPLKGHRDVVLIISTGSHMYSHFFSGHIFLSPFALVWCVLPITTSHVKISSQGDDNVMQGFGE